MKRGRPTVTCRSLFLGLWAITWLVASGAFGQADDASRSFGLDRRVPWTTSRLSGTPEPPPPYMVAPAFPKLNFVSPIAMAAPKGTNRLFVGEQRGRIYSFPNDPDCPQADLAFDLTRIHPDATALYSLAFHPDFARNRYVYVCCIFKDSTPDGTRISRFEVSRTDPPKIIPESEEVIITWLSGGHNGCCLVFGPDGYLYISTGDATAPAPPDGLNTGQDLSDLLSSILRIDVDHEEGGKPYRIPPDNPFVNTRGARPEIWAFGFRNPWRMSFDRARGDLWVGDVGWELWELVYRVERGGNYGWSVMEGPQPVRIDSKRGPGPIIPPVVAHPHSEAASITGGYVYRGSALHDLVGAYVYGDFQTGKVWGLWYDGKQVVRHQELANTPLMLVSFGEDQNGELYALDYDRSKQIYKFVPNPAAKSNNNFPRRLSETGLFASTKDLKPAPGVIGYSINSAQWADYAEAQRHLALPARGGIEIDDRGYWRLPDGSALARTVSLELERGNPRSRRRAETQILHREDGSWRPYTYVWDDDQADATLAAAQGATRTFAIADHRAPGGRRNQAYRIHGRAECLLCHNLWAELQTTNYGRQSASPLGLTTAQLNRNHNYGGTVANQVRTLEHIRLLARPLPAGKLPSLADPYDESADLEARARSYLSVNCAHCHSFNAGGTANILLSSSLPLAQTQTVGVRPIQGTFGISDARIIAPGSPEGSVLLYRMAKLGGGRMPRVGSNLVDERALKMIAAWIAGMPAPGGASARLDAEDAAALTALRNAATTPPDILKQAIRRLASSTTRALALIRLIDAGNVSEPAIREVAAISASTSAGEVRDLLERFIPESGRIKRLGDSFDPADILALKGDPERGKQIFLTDSAAQCKTCHKVDGTGIDIGPDLSKIGTKYPKPDLLRHTVDPSREIDPKFASFLLETKAGQVYSGILVEKSPQEVVLKDARNELIRVRAADVDQLVSQPKSLMPELLLRDMTAQQAADLLEFLATRK